MMGKPKIRFKGYNEDWEQRKLGEDLISIHTGTNLLGSVSNTGIPLIKMGNIQRGYFDISKVEYLAESEQPEREDVVNYGDFLFNTRNTLELVGKGATWMENSGKFAFNSNIARFELKDLNTIFFNYLYNTEDITKQIHARAVGTTSVAAIYPKTLESVEYFVPCIVEQEKIGNYFSNLDHLITLHQHKCDEMKKLKKCMLQKMFPENGKKVPEIRFDGFTNDWEQRKLGDLVNRVSRKNQDLVSELPLTISAQYGLIDQNEFFNKRVASKDVSGYYLIENGEFAYNKSTSTDAPWGTIKRLDRYENGVLSTLYIVFGIKENNPVDSDFLVSYYSTNLWHKGIHEIAAEGARNHGLLNISPMDFFETKLMIPQDIEEQKKIGKYFEELERLITLHQHKCDELQNLKKYMLQNMFV